jgi:hypothetical protein
VTPFPLLDGIAETELHAMRLDGESYLLGDAHVPIGFAVTPSMRAVVALGARSPRLVAARRTAAWVWGATPSPPDHGEYLVDLDARWRPQPADGIRVIESVVRDGDVTRLGRVAVTTPLRTAVDLARFLEEFGDAECELLARLALCGGFGPSEAIDTMERGRNLAGKHRAAERLRSALSPS